MGQTFAVVPQEVEGCARLVETTGVRLDACAIHIERWSSGAEGFTGLMRMIEPLVKAYAGAQDELLSGWSDTLRTSADNTTDAAWVFLSCDSANSGRFNRLQGYPGDGLQGAQTPMEGGVSYYGANATTSLPDPAGDDADMSDLIQEVGGPLAEIDDVLGWVTDLFGTEWRPVTEVLEPLAGDWGALERAGSALKGAGEEMEELWSTLDLGRRRVGGHWDGATAQTFDAHLTAFVRAIEDDGVLNRIIGEVYALVAPQIRAVAGQIVEQLNWLVDQVLQQLASSVFPPAGVAKAAKWLWDAWNKVEEIMDLIAKVTELIETVGTLLKFAQDPVGAAQSYLQEQLSPVAEGADRADELLDLAADATALGEMDIDDAPTSGVSTTGGAPDGR